MRRECWLRRHGHVRSKHSLPAKLNRAKVSVGCARIQYLADCGDPRSENCRSGRRGQGGKLRVHRDAAAAETVTGLTAMSNCEEFACWEFICRVPTEPPIRPGGDRLAIRDTFVRCWELTCERVGSFGQGFGKFHRVPFGLIPNRRYSVPNASSTLPFLSFPPKPYPEPTNIIPLTTTGPADPIVPPRPGILLTVS
jgi:hypothetical protein